MVRSTAKIKVNVGKSGSENYKVYARIDRVIEDGSSSIDLYQEPNNLGCSGRYFHFDVNDKIVYDGQFNITLTQEQSDTLYLKVAGSTNKNKVKLEMLYYAVIQQMISEYEGLLTEANLEIFYGSKLAV